MCAQIEYDNGAPVAIDWQDNGIENLGTRGIAMILRLNGF